MARISKLDLNELNRELQKLEDLKRELETLRQTQAKHQKDINNLNIHAAPTSNDITFNWTGSTGTISWGAGSVKDKTGANVPIPASSISGLTANKYYWLAWNRVHQQMLAQIGVDSLFNNKNNLVICQVFTGTAGESGVLGGGGSNSAISDLSGAKYKLF